MERRLTFDSKLGLSIVPYLVSRKKEDMVSLCILQLQLPSLMPHGGQDSIEMKEGRDFL